MNYQHVIQNGQWRITANGELLPEVYQSGIDVARALSKLRQGHTATIAATISRKQAARREQREATGR